MIGIGTLAKLARMGNASTIDQLSEILKAMGLEANFQELMQDQKPMAFQRVSQLAASPESQVMLMRCQGSDGSQFVSLMVIAPVAALPGGKKTLALAGDVGVVSGGRVLESPGEPKSLRKGSSEFSRPPVQTSIAPSPRSEKALVLFPAT